MSFRKRMACGQCQADLTSPEEPCSKCGPIGIVHIATGDDVVIASDDYAARILGGKYKPGPGKKVRRTREYSNVAGRWKQDPNRPTRQIQDIDRVNNQKVHVVKDATTGDELLRKVEPLDQAGGRGSDKPALRAALRKRKGERDNRR
jgi:hypothetical protein